jgi:hypothetical protein
MGDDKKKGGGFFGFMKEVVDAATKDQEDKDSAGYKIGDAIEKGSNSIFDSIFGGKK